MTEGDDVLAIVVAVARAFERAGIEYLVGGSIASSMYGEPRATRDLDFAVRLTREQLPALLSALGGSFAVDEQALADAIAGGRSATIFFLQPFMKVDLFMRGEQEYDRAEFSRKQRVEPIPGEPVAASSAEDNLLWKLRWFQMGGEVSDQQWRDVLGLLRLGGATLDLEYARKWAEEFGVGSLLARAIAQAG